LAEAQRQFVKTSFDVKKVASDLLALFDAKPIQKSP